MHNWKKNKQIEKQLRIQPVYGSRSSQILKDYILYTDFEKGNNSWKWTNNNIKKETKELMKILYSTNWEMKIIKYITTHMHYHQIKEHVIVYIVMSTG